LRNSRHRDWHCREPRLVRKPTKTLCRCCDTQPRRPDPAESLVRMPASAWNRNAGAPGRLEEGVWRREEGSVVQGGGPRSAPQARRRRWQECCCADGSPAGPEPDVPRQRPLPFGMKIQSFPNGQGCLSPETSPSSCPLSACRLHRPAVLRQPRPVFSQCCAVRELSRRGRHRRHRRGRGQRRPPRHRRPGPGPPRDPRQAAGRPALLSRAVCPESASTPAKPS